MSGTQVQLIKLHDYLQNHYYFSFSNSGVWKSKMYIILYVYHYATDLQSVFFWERRNPTVCVTEFTKADKFL